MANKRHKPEEIVLKLRQVDVLVGQIEGIGPITATALAAAVGDRLLQERTPVCRLAWTGSKAKVERREVPVVRDQ
jgi:transposase